MSWIMSSFVVRNWQPYLRVLDQLYSERKYFAGRSQRISQPLQRGIVWLYIPLKTNTPENQMNSIDQFLNQIRPKQKTLLNHSVYSQVKDLESLKVFMGSHVFAVWDFMTLLKSLQKQITCVHTPWLPLKDTFSARFVNEIVLAEETDEVRPGCYMSHFELYLQAMEEVGADTKHILGFLHELRTGWGSTPGKALRPLPIPESIKNFCTKHCGIFLQIKTSGRGSFSVRTRGNHPNHVSKGAGRVGENPRDFMPLISSLFKTPHPPGRNRTCSYG